MVKMKKIIICIAVLSLLNAVLFAENETHIIPIINYDYFLLETQAYHSPGVGLVFTMGNMEPVFPEERNNFAIAAFYKPYIMMEEMDYPSFAHGIEFMVNRRIRSHQILGQFSAQSSDPVYGGFHTFFTGVGYGNELIRNEHFSLTLGAGIAVGDFSEIFGQRFYCFPIPIVEFNMDYPWLNLGFEFYTEPALSITIAPKSRIRFTGMFTTPAFRNIEDLFFECTLWYRFFGSDHKLGDFAGLGIGVMNNGMAFTVSERDKTYELSYYAAFAKLDLSFLQLSGGYILSGREIYDLDTRKDAGKGFFVSVQAAYQF